MSGSTQPSATRHGAAPFPATYRFHDLFSVRVAHRGLANGMRDEFAPFLDGEARPDDPVDLVIEEGEVAPPDHLLSTNYGFDKESLVMMTPSGRVRMSGDVVRAEPTVSPDLIYRRWIDNRMALRILSRGAALVHSSAVARDGVGYLFPGWAAAGKTTVALEFSSHGYAFMADDWCFVSRTGEILGYPRWLTFLVENFVTHPELLDAIADLKERRAIARRLALNRFAQSLDASHAVSADLSHRIEGRFFIHARVPIDRVVPGCTTALRAPLTKAFLLSTSGSRRIVLSSLPPETLARRAALSAKHERKMSLQDQTVLGFAGFPSEPEDPVKTMTAVLLEAFRHTPCFELSIPCAPTKDELRHIRSLVESA